MRWARKTFDDGALEVEPPGETDDVDSDYDANGQSNAVKG